MRSDAAFTLKVEATSDYRCANLILTGHGAYDLTAEIIAYAAGQMLRPDYDRAGVLAPASAFDPRALLAQATTHWGVSQSRGTESQ